MFSVQQDIHWTAQSFLQLMGVEACDLGSDVLVCAQVVLRLQQA